jgi:hypothetical protein
MKDKELFSKASMWAENFDQTRESNIHHKLAEFKSLYAISKMAKIDKEDYVYGRYFEDYKKTFCYFMEKELSDFGRISGSPCSQYGVWYGTHGEDKKVKYRNTKKYGGNVNDAMEALKQSISELYSFGKEKDYESISGSKIGNKFKGKILSTYFPDVYLSIYADDYLDDILRYFNLDNGITYSDQPIFKQIELLKWKDQNEIMKSWSLIKFAMFLNDELDENFYDKKHKKQKEDLVPPFPDSALVYPIEVPDDIDEDFVYDHPTAKQHNKTLLDYTKRTIRNKAIGDRGEKIVFDSEIKRVAGFPKCKGKKVDWVSKRTDGYGFDIISFDEQGKEIQIEVKSTTQRFGKAELYLTRFEYDIAEQQSNYQIYYVFEVESITPKIWKIAKPFHPNKKGIHLIPCAYKVVINPRI